MVYLHTYCVFIEGPQKYTQTGILDLKKYMYMYHPGEKMMKLPNLATLVKNVEIAAMAHFCRPDGYLFCKNSSSDRGCQMVFFKPKFLIWVNFGGTFNKMLPYFMDICYII
jgi:hypothetical protein